ncbi:MAG: HNH endonuclease signature motif containing protein [bacterium]
MKPYGKCWTYQGSTTDGYGQARWEGTTVLVHRKVFEVLVGPLLPGLEIDHLYRNRACYNPAHLEQVTKQVNISRGAKATATHCPYGHSLEGAPLVRGGPGGCYFGRRCRVCHNERERNRKRRIRSGR